MAVLRNADTSSSQPLASLLKAATAAAHENAEHSQGAALLTRGELDKEEYIRFLIMLFHVYNNLETALEKHCTHPALSPTYNPTLLARAPALSADIAFLLDVPESEWRNHPLHTALEADPPQPFADYVTRIADISDSADPSPLLAHSYVRYLGDLSGGQVIRRAIAKAYGTADREDGAGTQFYEFKQLGGGKVASIGDMRKIKEWFREGMNAGGGEDEARKRAICEEAVRVFGLNVGLFSVLQAPSGKNAAIPTQSTSPPLGNPSPLPTPPPGSSFNFSSDPDKKHVSNIPYSPLQALDGSDRPDSKDGEEEGSFGVQSVITIVLAIALAHFALVTGGFTGAKGMAKLQTVQEWVADRLPEFLGAGPGSAN